MSFLLFLFLFLLSFSFFGRDSRKSERCEIVIFLSMFDRFVFFSIEKILWSFCEWVFSLPNKSIELLTHRVRPRTHQLRYHQRTSLNMCSHTHLIIVLIYHFSTAERFLSFLFFFIERWKTEIKRAKWMKLFMHYYRLIICPVLIFFIRIFSLSLSSSECVCVRARAYLYENGFINMFIVLWTSYDV